jgi:hypothetical protein
MTIMFATIIARFISCTATSLRKAKLSRKLAEASKHARTQTAGLSHQQARKSLLLSGTIDPPFPCVHTSVAQHKQKALLTRKSLARNSCPALHSVLPFSLHASSTAYTCSQQKPPPTSNEKAGAGARIAASLRWFVAQRYNSLAVRVAWPSCPLQGCISLIDNIPCTYMLWTCDEAWPEQMIVKSIKGSRSKLSSRRLLEL